MAGSEIKLKVEIDDLVEFDRVNHESSVAFKKMIRQAQVTSLFASSCLMIVLVGYMYYESKHADIFLIGGTLFAVHVAYTIWGLPKVILKRNSMFVKKKLANDSGVLVGDITLTLQGDRLLVNAPMTVGEKSFPLSSIRAAKQGGKYLYLFLPFGQGERTVLVINFDKVSSSENELVGFLNDLHAFVK